MRSSRKAYDAVRISLVLLRECSCARAGQRGIVHDYWDAHWSVQVLHQVKLLAGQRLVKPVVEAFAITDFLLTNPIRAGRQLAEPDRSHFARAVTYFIAALSTAIVFNQVSSFALGIKTVDQWLYWTMSGAMVVCIAALALVIGWFLGAKPPKIFINAAFLAYGASLLIGSFILAGASLTLAGLRYVSFIPDFNSDLASFENFKTIAMQTYLDCLRDESVLFNAIYNGWGGAFEGLPFPLDELSYVQPAFHAAASVLFIAMVFSGGSPRWTAAAAAALSVTAVVGSVLYGFAAYGEHLYSTTPCSALSIEAAGHRTAEDQVRMLAQRHAKNIGQNRGATMLTAVEAKQRSLIFHVRIDERATEAQNFEKWASAFRLRAVRDFCTSESGAYFRKLGISQVWVLRYDDSELAQTVVQSADQCLK